MFKFLSQACGEPEVPGHSKQSVFAEGAQPFIHGSAAADGLDLMKGGASPFIAGNREATKRQRSNLKSARMFDEANLRDVSALLPPHEPLVGLPTMRASEPAAAIQRPLMAFVDNASAGLKSRTSAPLVLGSLPTPSPFAAGNAVEGPVPNPSPFAAANVQRQRLAPPLPFQRRSFSTGGEASSNLYRQRQWHGNRANSAPLDSLLLSESPTNQTLGSGSRLGRPPRDTTLRSHSSGGDALTWVPAPLQEIHSFNAPPQSAMPIQRVWSSPRLVPQGQSRMGSSGVSPDMDEILAASPSHSGEGMEHILKLLSQLFNADAIILTLYNPERTFIKCG